MNIERDKYLTEAMGLCWHEWVMDRFVPVNYSVTLRNR